MAVLSALRTHLPGLVLWIVFAYLAIVFFEAILWERVRWLSYVPGAIGCGIGLYVAQRGVALPHDR